ncbi:complement component C1q receptor [Coregonus clupeaformis]|uniref:complement component C1q receptor n=1 Tax=Coregonus clupeaformis TaxID=59861 RepID=UPI001E1C9BD9|nr:complement component C1q receptor [Coregonus clupeaformis]
MGSPVRCTAAVVVSLLGLLYYSPPVLGQELQERDALCNEDGCFVVYFQRKTFLDSWRSCKEKGGNLATVKLQEEADTIAALFSSVELRSPRTMVRVWIGLQRQPRQCTASRPLRGFTWTTGDQDTQYTNWLRDDSPSTCSAPRCVVMTYGTAAHEQHDNFKWLDGSCSVPVDGYLCRYTYKGMCPAVWREGGGNALYSTPFSLLSSLLTHVPFGSVATMPCPGRTEEEQSVLCMLREDGTVGWSREMPLCTDTTEKSWCDRDNGGCEHFCREAGEHYYCECSDGFQLGDNGQTCGAVDPCHSAPCEFECLPLSDGYRCACPEGYMLAPDERGCLDVDECLQSPCEQLCVNAPGTFECRCREGYRPDEEGECEDVDECMEDPCEHACENTPGSHVCHCHLGFSPLPEDPSHCQDTDECQIPGTCQQMCVNYEGGFECYCEVGYELLSDHFSCRKIGEGEDSTTAATPSYPWVTRQPGPKWDPQEPVYHWIPQQANTDWPPEEEESLDWLTDPPRLESDIIWVTSAPQEEPVLNHNPFLVPPTEEPEEEEEEEEEYTPGWDIMNWNAPAKVQPELEPTPSLSPSPTSDTSPTPTPTPDWYEEEEDDETTTSPSVLPTSTISGGAWNWFWISSTTSSQEEGLTMWQEPITDQYVPASNYDEAEENEEEGGIDDEWVISPPEMGQGENQKQHTPSLPPPLAPQTPLTPDQGVKEVEVEVEDERGPPQEDEVEGDERGPPQEDEVEWEDERGPPQEDEVEGKDERGPPQEDEVEGKDERGPPQEDEVEGEDERGPTQEDEEDEVEGEDERGPPQEDEVEGEDERGPPQEDEVEGEDERGPPQEDESSQKQDGVNWLLVGLLVPLCIFIVVMVALGIIYCTRCAVTPRNKSATDCYHWISGAHDKQGAPNPSKGMQSHV